MVSPKTLARAKALRAELAALGHTRVNVGGFIKRALDADPTVQAATIAETIAAEEAAQLAAEKRSVADLKKLLAKLETL